MLIFYISYTLALFKKLGINTFTTAAKCPNCTYFVQVNPSLYIGVHTLAKLVDLIQYHNRPLIVEIKS